MVECRYQLEQKEVEESLLCLGYKREGWFLKIQIGVLSVIGFILLGSYIKWPGQVFWLFTAAFDIGLMMFILYLPPLRRKVKARKMVDGEGNYYLRIETDGVIGGEIKEKLSFARYQPVCYVSDRIITLKMGKKVYCIPKRILTTKDQREIIDIVKQSGCGVKEFKTIRG